MKMRTMAIAALVALGLLAAACGGGDTTTTTGAGTVATTGSDIEMVTVDFEFIPDEWTVAAGSGLTVELDNQGTLVHDWVVLSAEISNEGDFDEDLVIWRTKAQSGEKVTDTIATDLAPGTYQVICDIPGHFSAGMKGTLTVTG